MAVFDAEAGPLKTLTSRIGNLGCELMLKGERTRQRIIAKAAPLFNRKGYDGCSMQDISAATGLEKASLYGHFATKEELAVAAFDHAWAQVCSARVGNLDEAPNGVDKLKLHIANFVSKPSFPGGCPMLNTVASGTSVNPPYDRPNKHSR